MSNGANFSSVYRRIRQTLWFNFLEEAVTHKLLTQRWLGYQLSHTWHYTVYSLHQKLQRMNRKYRYPPSMTQTPFMGPNFVQQEIPYLKPIAWIQCGIIHRPFQNKWKIGCKVSTSAHLVSFYFNITRALTKINRPLSPLCLAGKILQRVECVLSQATLFQCCHSWVQRSQALGIERW